MSQNDFVRAAHKIPQSVRNDICEGTTRRKRCFGKKIYFFEKKLIFWKKSTFPQKNRFFRKKSTFYPRENNLLIYQMPPGGHNLSMMCVTSRLSWWVHVLDCIALPYAHIICTYVIDVLIQNIRVASCDLQIEKNRKI